MRLLIPKRDITRYARNSAILQDYERMLREDKALNMSQRHTILAAQYGISVTMIRKILEVFHSNYPVVEVEVKE